MIVYLACLKLILAGNKNVTNPHTHTLMINKAKYMLRFCFLYLQRPNNEALTIFTTVSPPLDLTSKPSMCCYGLEL